MRMIAMAACAAVVACALPPAKRGSGPARNRLTWSRRGHSLWHNPDVLKSQVKHVWTLHALCVEPSYDKEGVQQVRLTLAKLQMEEREAVKQMQVPFDQR